MGKKFKYDIYSLIEMVESHQCLWDKANEASKDKIVRRNAWRDICLSLEPEFQDMDPETQDDIISTVTTKWCNIRDTFMKSLKTKPGQPPKKKYLYSNSLQFLFNTIPPDEIDPRVSKNDSHSSPSKTKPINITGTKRLNTIDEEISKALHLTSAAELIDDDLAFMMSLLPTLKQLKDDDKFQFRIEVMQLLRRYHNRRLSSDTADPLCPKRIRKMSEN